MENNEKILKYSWKEFVKSPMSFVFFIFLLAVGFLMYLNIQDKDSYKSSLEECQKGRLKDKEIYINLLQNLKIGNELKKDSVK